MEECSCQAGTGHFDPSFRPRCSAAGQKSDLAIYRHMLLIQRYDVRMAESVPKCSASSFPLKRSGAFSCPAPPASACHRRHARQLQRAPARPRRRRIQTARPDAAAEHPAAPLPRHQGLPRPPARRRRLHEQGSQLLAISRYRTSAAPASTPAPRALPCRTEGARLVPPSRLPAHGPGHVIRAA